MFYSSKEKKLITLDEYISKMPDGQNTFINASGESVDRIQKCLRRIGSRYKVMKFYISLTM